MPGKEGRSCFHKPGFTAIDDNSQKMVLRAVALVLIVGVSLRFGVPLLQAVGSGGYEFQAAGFFGDVDPVMTGSLRPSGRNREGFPPRPDIARAKRELIARLRARAFLEPGAVPQSTTEGARVRGKFQDRVSARSAGRNRSGTPVFVSGSDWQSRSFQSVKVIDGRTFVANDMTIRLVGVDLPAEDEICQLLDGRLRSCLDRAEAQLDLTTRRRRLTCEIRPLRGGGHLYGGKCRIGTIDLNTYLEKRSWARSIRKDRPSRRHETANHPA